MFIKGKEVSLEEYQQMIETHNQELQDLIKQYNERTKTANETKLSTKTLPAKYQSYLDEKPRMVDLIALFEEKSNYLLKKTELTTREMKKIADISNILTQPLLTD